MTLPLPTTYDAGCFGPVQLVSTELSLKFETIVNPHLYLLLPDKLIANRLRTDSAFRFANLRF